MPVLLYGSETWTLTLHDWKRLDSFHTWCQWRILHICWHDHVSNDEVLRLTGLLPASFIVRKWRLGLFGHLARLADDVPANQLLRTCCKVQVGDRPSPGWKRARGRPPTTWIYQIGRDTGVPVTDAMQLAEDIVLATDRNGGMLWLTATRQMMMMMYFLPVFGDVTSKKVVTLLRAILWLGKNYVFAFFFMFVVTEKERFY